MANRDRKRKVPFSIFIILMTRKHGKYPTLKLQYIRKFIIGDKVHKGIEFDGVRMWKIWKPVFAIMENKQFNDEVCTIYIFR